MTSEAANDPALIQLGNVLPGATRILGLGVSETYRGVIETGGGTVNCYVKFLDIRELFNEALGAVLCKLAGLRTPDAYVVQARLADYPTSVVLARAGTPEVVAFATAAMPLESFVRRADLRSPDARRAAVAQWTEWPEVLTFDQWIRNVDRHPGNFLIGGPGEVYLIDHGLAFGGSNWTAAILAGLTNDVMTRLWAEVISRRRSRSIRTMFQFTTSAQNQALVQKRISRRRSRSIRTMFQFTTSAQNQALVQAEGPVEMITSL